MQKILILGGGFAGLSAALNAADQNAEHGGDIGVTLVSPDEHLTIRPRLYQPNPETLRAPLLPSLEPAGVAFVKGTARALDTASRRVTVAADDGATTTIGYDRLVLATGSELGDLSLPGVADHTWNIDTYAAAVALDEHLRALGRRPETAGRDTVVIVGAGMSGIELATEMRRRLEAHGGTEAAARARIVLVEQADVVGPEFGDDPRPLIEKALALAKVETRLGVRLSEVDGSGVTLNDGERIEAATTVVTIGLRASPLAEQVPAERDRLGRLVVDDWQRVAGVPGLFATGDVARARIGDGEHVAPMSCQHGRTMGKYAGYNAARDLLGLPLRRYRQPAYTTTLDLGEMGAVFTIGWPRLVLAAGAEAKQRKRMINEERIYPPTGDRAQVFAAMRIDELTGR